MSKTVDRLFLKGDTFVTRSVFVAYLYDCVERWKQLANNCTYSRRFNKPDPEILAQAKMVQKKARFYEKGATTTGRTHKESCEHYQAFHAR